MEVDAANSCVNIHFVGYPDKDDQWQPFMEEDFPVVIKMPRFDYKSETMDERRKCFENHTLSGGQKTPTGKKESDTEVMIELLTQFDAYENLFGKVGTVTRSKPGKLMREVRNAEMESILGAK